MGPLIHYKRPRGTTIEKDPGSIATDDPLAFFPDVDGMGLGVAWRREKPGRFRQPNTVATETV